MIVFSLYIYIFSFGYHVFYHIKDKKIDGVALCHPPKVAISKMAYQFQKYDAHCIWNVDESGAQTGKNGGVRALASK